MTTFEAEGDACQPVAPLPGAGPDVGGRDIVPVQTRKPTGFYGAIER